MGSTLRQREIARQPLRRVLGERQRRIAEVDGRPIYSMGELLECGHIIRIKRDWIGETHADRRRCYKCAASKPADLLPTVFPHPTDTEEEEGE